MASGGFALEPQGTSGSALFSECGRYRYRLSREWGVGEGRCLFVMLNPSTADASLNDPTITRCINFAKGWGFAALDVGNIFAWRSTEPAALYDLADPIGPDNDAHLRVLAAQADRVIAAWGNHGELGERGWDVLELLRSAGRPPMCFRMTGLRQPEHPLYKRADSPLIYVPFDVGQREER